MITIFRLDKKEHRYLVDALGENYAKKVDYEGELVDVLLSDNIMIKCNDGVTLDRGGKLATLPLTSFHYISIS